MGTDVSWVLMLHGYWCFMGTDVHGYWCFMGTDVAWVL